MKVSEESSTFRKGSYVFQTGGASTISSDGKSANLNELRKISNEPSSLSSGNSGIFLDLGSHAKNSDAFYNDSSLLTAPGAPLMGKSSLLGDKHNSNEDRAAYDIFEVNGQIYCYAAVFDGHGGEQCSDFLSHAAGGHVRASFGKEHAWESGEEVLKDTFHQIDKQFCSMALKRKDYSGACATIVVIREDELIVGNVGDCRAVIVPVGGSGNYMEPWEITVDHRADCTSENMRINEAGGKVEDGRVLSLQPSRSFGDIDVKLAAGKDVVIASPDVDRVIVKNSAKSKAKKTLKKNKSSKSNLRRASRSSRILNTVQTGNSGENRAFLIIASDGVWDVLDNKAAANCVKSTLKSLSSQSNAPKLGLNLFSKSRRNSKVSEESETLNDAEICADKLVKLAKEKGSDDDITAVVILF